VLSSTAGNAKPIFRTMSKLIVLLGMSAIIRANDLRCLLPISVQW
jgi:hypothetical protein